MNDQDKETFEKWWLENSKRIWESLSGKELCLETWQAACDYKQKEYSNIMQAMTQTSQNNFKLQAENDILSGEIFTYKKMSDDAFKKLAVAVEALEFYRDICNGEKAIEALKELGEK